ncbi:hypothetical protein [Loktanella sp. Alg231-35]|uniref:hypothetical protein n=1 Tax=Loktanella sp. Alg231-35 TaxID=1922220 RepID=UPI000D54F8C9|nr:hypothetical protein [Loktanella sp. Alg231-35]
MDDANKILDVTYGTFSCRLEGFEDSVETMKTVVSYFHDLAGHDRFMDLEPQAPDMDTLARLTEEQSGVPVEIEGEGQNVSLRAAGAAAAAGVAAGALLDDDDTAEAAEDAAEQNIWSDDAHADDIEVDEIEFADQSDVSEDDAVEDSVADKLKRIREVVEQGPVEDTEEVYAEDEVDPEDSFADADPLSQRLSELAAQAAEPESSEEVVSEDDLAALDAEDFAENGEVVAPEMEHQAAVDEDAPLSDAVTEADLGGAEATMDDTDDPDVAEDAMEEDASADKADADDYDDIEVDAVAETSEAEDDVIAVDESLADADEALEAVEAVAEDDFDEEEAEDTAEDVEAAEPAVEPEPTPETASDTGLLVLTAKDAAQTPQASDDDDDDDDFDLQAEVAKVAAELAARKGNELARHGLPRSVDDAMSRILSQTDQHLNQPESRRHRDAFAQLKAAVAATEAARQLGDDGADAKDVGEQFKDDLGAHDAEERSQTPPPAAPPLKLVKTVVLEETPDAIADYAAQIEAAPQAPAAAPAAAEDTPAAKPMDAASQRLRQIAATKETSEVTNADGFRELAAKQGAVETIDLIEAAAAYLYYVESEDDFSRPQVMKKVQAATGQEISREDGLRAFGRLLRLAKIVKLDNGRFRVSDSSDYRPDGAQAAQG